MTNPTAPTLEEIYEPIEAPVQVVPQTILDILSTSNELAEDVMRYFFSGKGKLLRPALTLLGAGIKGAGDLSDSRLLKLASSYEIFHGATLIHDDIIDSAYLRRNLPTINVKWNSQVAVLVGDFLHDKALKTIFENGNREIFSRFLETAGLVCDGEIHELHRKGSFDLKEEEYIQIIDKKTAVLLACCVEAGGLFAGANPKEAAALEQFGRWFGIAFQIVDDCLDFTGNEHEFGKTLGADIAAGVLTLPLIRLLQVADSKTKAEIFDIFKSDATSGKFAILLDKIRQYETLEYSLDKARQYSQKARAELQLFPDSPSKASLLKLVDYVLDRSR